MPKPSRILKLGKTPNKSQKNEIPGKKYLQQVKNIYRAHKKTTEAWIIIFNQKTQTLSL